MPDRPAPESPREAQPDLERDAGFRGEAFSQAAWALGLFFAAGLALVLFVVVRRRRRSPG